eukprot:COSAG03_NODE_10673_length_636_cov_1.519553_1_plen_78_part_01
MNSCVSLLACYPRTNDCSMSGKIKRRFLFTERLQTERSGTQRKGLRACCRIETGRAEGVTQSTCACSERHRECVSARE